MNNDEPKFSVLISVYKKENARFFDECLDSLYTQTVKADEWVIVKDGPLTEELDAVIEKYKNEGVNIKEVALPRNRGLGYALSVGIKECSNELVARMDTDDICVSNRFELQVKEFKNDPELELCGGKILEFEDDVNHPIAERRVPLARDEIVKYHRKRNAFNHMTVMYKRSSVINAGNYKGFLFMEDYVLWLDMLRHGVKCKNIDEYLCNVRTNKDMVARRGGYDNYKRYKIARKYAYKLKFISYYDYVKMNFIQFAVCMMPKSLRKFIYFGFIHKKVKN